MIRLETITTDAGFQSLQQGWNELLAASSQVSIFLSWEWVATWWQTFGHDHRLLLFVARGGCEPDSGQLLGIAPFVISVSRPSTLRFMGNPFVASDHLEFLVRPGYEEAVVDAFGQGIVTFGGSWSLARFDGLSQHSRLLVLAERLARWGRHYQWPIRAPYIELPSSWEQYLKRRSRNFRYTLSRHQRKLQAEFPDRVRFHRISDDDDLTKAMKELFLLHQQVKEAAGLPGAFSDTSKQQFHLMVAAQFLERGWLRLYELRIDNSVIASIYCFFYRRRLFFYQTGYSLAWARFRPGQQLMAYAVRSAIEEGAAVFDFLRGDEQYKWHWTDDAVTDQNILVPSDLGAAVRVEIYRAGRSIKQLVKGCRARRRRG